MRHGYAWRLGDADGFEVIDTLASTQALQNLSFFFPQLGRNEEGDGASNGLFQREFKDSCGCRIPAGDDSVEILGDDGIVRGCDDGGESSASRRRESRETGRSYWP